MRFFDNKTLIRATVATIFFALLDRLTFGKMDESLTHSKYQLLLAASVFFVGSCLVDKYIFGPEPGKDGSNFTPQPNKQF
jgi:hypothetical protein